MATKINKNQLGTGVYTSDSLTAGTNISITNGVVSSPNSVQSTTVTTIVKLTQSEYDALVQAGTVDANTFYAIYTPAA